MLLPEIRKMREAAESKKSSMQLLIGTYTWALSKIRESPEDQYADEIIKRHEIGITLPPALAIKPPTCLRNTGSTVKCKEGPKGQNKCGLCKRRGI